MLPKYNRAADAHTHHLHEDPTGVCLAIGDSLIFHATTPAILDPADIANRSGDPKTLLIPN